MADDDNKDTDSGPENQSDDQIFAQLTSLQDVSESDLPDAPDQAATGGEETVVSPAQDTPALADFRRGSSTDVNTRVVAEDNFDEETETEAEDYGQSDQDNDTELSLQSGDLSLSLSGGIMVDGQVQGGGGLPGVSNGQGAGGGDPADRSARDPQSRARPAGQGEEGEPEVQAEAQGADETPAQSQPTAAPADLPPASSAGFAADVQRFSGDMEPTAPRARAPRAVPEPPATPTPAAAEPEETPPAAPPRPTGAVTLSAAPVTEGSDITITARVDEAPETDLILTLSNGAEITIAAGTTSGATSFANTNTDDVYADGGTLTYSVSSSTGGNYEALDISGASVDVAVTDTVDTVAVTLEAQPVTEGSDITITARVDEAPETDLVLTLSNGAEITIAAGTTSGATSFANPNTDDVYADGETLTYAVSSSTGGNYEALDISGASVDVAVSDTVDTTTVTLEAQPVTEGTDITITARVEEAPETDLVLTLSNGAEITIAAGETSGATSFANTNTDDVYADGGTLTYAVSSSTGGNYEALDISGASVDVAVSDTVDTVTVSIAADGDVTEAEAASFTVSVSRALEDDLVVTLSDGQSVTIEAGATSASYSVAAQGEDVFADASEVSVSVTGASVADETFEDLVIDGTEATVAVSDTVDTVTVTLEAQPVSEGTDITITARVEEAPETDLVLTLSNGAEITIASGETSGSTSFANPNIDDVYADGETLTYSVSSSTGGNYEALDISGASVDVAVTDTVDTVAVTLEAAPVTEGSDITITARVDEAPETDLVLTLSNGAEITIAAGETSGATSFTNPNTDDVYADGETLTYAVSSSTGGNYEALDISGASVDVAVSDTVDTVTVSIAADGDVTEAEAASFTVSVSRALEDDLVVTLSDGQSVTIEAGATSASYSVAAQGEDVFADASEVSVSVTGASVAGETFEDLVIDGTEATVAVSDTVDTVAVTLEAQPVTEGSDITITARVDEAPETDLVLTLSNGAEITIAAGTTSGATSFANPNTDDVYADGETLTYSVSSSTGGNYEALDISGASVDVAVSDTLDTVTVSIASDGDVTEAEAASFTVSVSRALDDDLVVTLSDGQSVTIEAGATSASYSVAAQGEDVFADASAVTVSVTGASVAGETFEDLVIDGTEATVAVSDTVDTVAVTLEAQPVSEGTDITITARVEEAPETDLVLTLSNGAEITIAAGETSGATSFANTNTDDVYADGGTLTYSVSSSTGGNYEALDISGASVDVSVTDTVDTVAVTLEAQPVTEGSDITITARVDEAPETDLVLTLSNGAEITIAAGETVGATSFANTNTDDVYADGETLTYAVSSSTGGNYEALDISGASVDVAVSDTVDTTTVAMTLEAQPVTEGSDITITARVEEAPETDLVLTLSNGAEITIAAGETSGATSFANPNTDDVYADGGTLTYAVLSSTGGNYEALDISGASVDVAVSDTVDTVAVTLEAAPVTEGTDITITARVDEAPETDLVLTLSNGAEITIAAGETSGSTSFANTNTDDVYADGETLTYAVSSSTGGNYEALDISGASVDVSVTDTVDTVAVTLEAQPVTEGSDITITARVEEAPETDLVLTLSNGAEITIAAGETSGATSFANPNTDDVYADGETLTYAVSSSTGGNYEALDISGASVDVAVTDTLDTVTVSITADGDVTEAEAASFTVSVSRALDDDLVVTLSDGQSVTIEAGETSASYSVAAQGEDVFADASEVTVSVTGASVAGESFEDLVIDGTEATVAVSDTVDTVAVTLEAQPVTEGSDITITARVEEAPETDLVLTLSNGAEITIAAGETSGSTSFANTNTDDVYADGGTLTYGVSSSTGGNYEALDISGASVDVSVTDTVDTVAVTLEAQPVTEGTDITITARVEEAPETDLVLTLSNGAEITIAAGETSGATSFANTNTDDVYADGGTLTYSVSSSTGGNYEALDISGASVDVAVSDTVDTVAVTLEAQPVTEGTDITITARVEEAPETDLVLTLSNGAEITIAAGTTSGATSFANTNTDDVYADGETLTYSVSSSTGGNYEALDISGASVDVSVTDTVDTVAVTLEAQPVTEGTDITITARVEEAPETDLVLTLSNGAEITIAAGETSGATSFANPNTDDVYADGETLTYAVSSSTGGNYEALDISGASVDVAVSDTDTTTKVFLDDVVVTEGDAFQYSASVDNAPASDLTLTLSNGVTITIAAGETTGISESQTAPDTTAEFATTISIQSVTGGGYERLDTGDTATLRVLDIDHPATISGLGAAGGDLVLDEGDLAAGTNEVKDTLTQSGVFTISAEDGVGTLSISGTTVISNGVFTPVEITTALGNTLSITSYSAETGEVGYSYTLGEAEDHLDGQTPTETLSESFTVSLTDGDGDHDSATLSVRIEDDAPIATIAQNIVIAASAQDQPITADMGVTVGADLDGASVVIAGDGTAVTNAQGVALTSDGRAIVYVSDGNGGLNAVINSGTDAQETIFTVSPSIAADGTVSYSVELFGTIDPAVGHSFDLSSAEEVDSGKEDVVIVENDDGTTLTISAFENDGAETLTSTTGWEQEDVNISGQGMGVGNQFVSNSLKGDDDDDKGKGKGKDKDDDSDDDGNEDKVGEKLVLEFGKNGNPLSVGVVGMTIDHLEDGETLIWVAYSGDTMVGQGELAGSGKGSSSSSDQQLTVDPGQAFDRVELFAGENTDFRLAKDSIFTLDAAPQELNLSATITDGDNDQVTTDFAITFDALSQDDSVIEGGDGDDRIYGGAAVDTLTGGEGADDFVFETLSDLGSSSGAERKVISDFSSDEGDRLDLDSILGQIDEITNRISLNSDGEGPSSSSELTISAGEVDYDMVIQNLDAGETSGGETSYDALDIQTLLGASSNQSNWTDILSMSGDFNGETEDSWTFQIIDERPNLTYEPDPVTGNLVFRDPDGLRVYDVDIAVSQNEVTHDVDNVDEISWSS